MASCPLCLSAVKDDFGLIECENCGAQLIVHVDGHVEYQGNEPPPADEEPPPQDLADSSKVFEGANVFPPQQIDDGPEPPPPPLSAPAGLESSEESRGSAADSIPIRTLEHSKPSAPPIEDYNFDDGPPLEPPPPAYQSAATPDSPDLRDVANFGNSNISGGRDGSLRYTLKIEGIDTSDVRNAFREAITDRKLMWDTETILRSVRNGEVTIQNVSPSKAFIVISRLRSLPVRIQWEQYAVHQT